MKGAAKGPWVVRQPVPVPERDFTADVDDVDAGPRDELEYKFNGARRHQTGNS
jgi:hypothetical protein